VPHPRRRHRFGNGNNKRRNGNNGNNTRKRCRSRRGRRLHKHSTPPLIPQFLPSLKEIEGNPNLYTVSFLYSLLECIPDVGLYISERRTCRKRHPLIYLLRRYCPDVTGKPCRLLRTETERLQFRSAEELREQISEDRAEEEFYKMICRLQHKDFELERTRTVIALMLDEIEDTEFQRDDELDDELALAVDTDDEVDNGGWYI
jgi:hypothetical protein